MRHVKGKSDGTARKSRRRGTCGILSALAAPVRADDLKPQTVEAFDRYVQTTESQINVELARREPYLWIEGLPADRRANAEAQLRAGQVVIERLDTLNPGDHENPISVADGMIHHWIGTVFIPGATLAQTLALEEDYNHHQDYFRPDVMRSKILRHNGDDFTIELRLYKKKVITTVLDTEHEVRYKLRGLDARLEPFVDHADSGSGQCRRKGRAPGAPGTRPRISLAHEYVLALRGKRRRNVR